LIPDTFADFVERLRRKRISIISYEHDCRHPLHVKDGVSTYWAFRSQEGLEFKCIWMSFGNVIAATMQDGRFSIVAEPI
tara:strand:+ start:3149 stop:3385 length:237 start_codon:yes stop_codon:yes gene_type:complete